MIAVDCYSDRGEIESLRERWHRLWAITKDASFGQSFECFQAMIAAEEGVPTVFAATVSGRLIGLWPMFAAPGPFKLGATSKLEAATHLIPCNSIVGPSPAATAAIIARGLRSAGERRSIRFTEPRSADGTFGPATASFIAAGLRTEVESAPPIVEITLGGRWSDVLDRCDETIRLGIYQMQHYASEDYRFDRFRPGSMIPRTTEFDAALATAIEIISQNATICRPVFQEAAARGAADVAVLHFRGRPVAASLSFVTCSGLENVAIAIAPRTLPTTGTRLLYQLFRDGLARGDRYARFIAPPKHPVHGWAGKCIQRKAARVEFARPSGLRFLRVGSLRDVCRRIAAAG